MDLGASFAAFLILALGGWLLFNFTAKALALLISQVTGNMVHFRIISPIRLKDLSITFKKGPIASVTVGEMSCSVRDSLSPVLRRSGALKLHIAVKDVEVLLRPTVKSTRKKAKKKPRRPSEARGQHSGTGVWWFLSRVVGLLHVSMTDVIFTSTKVDNVSLHMNFLDLDCQRHATNRLNLRLECLPWHLLICRTAEEQSTRLHSLLSLLSGSKKTEVCVPVVTLESMVIDLAVGFEKAHGICVMQAGVACGEMAVNLNEQLAWLHLEGTVESATPARSESIESQQSAAGSTTLDPSAPWNLLEEEVHQAAKNVDLQGRSPLAASVDGAAAAQAASALNDLLQPSDGPSHDGDALNDSKRGFRLPDQVTFQLPCLKVSWAHASLEHVLLSGFTGLQVEAKGTQADHQAGSSGLLDVQCQCGAFELLRGTDMALVDVVRSVVHASIQVPSSQGEPLRAAVDVKVGGATCNVSPNLDPWLTIALGAVKFLQSRKAHRSAVGKSVRSPGGQGAVGAESGAGELGSGEPAAAGAKKRKSSKLLWDVAVSAPDAVLVLYGPFEVEVLKVTAHSAHTWIAASGPQVLEANCEFDELLFHFVEPEAIGRSIKRLSSDPLLLSSAPETHFAKLLRLRHLEVQWGSQGLEAEDPASASATGDVRAVQIEIVGGGLFLDMQQIRALVKESDALLAYLKGKFAKDPSKDSSAKKSQPKRKKRAAVEQVRFSMEAFALEIDRVMEFRVVTVEGNPKSDGRPDLAQIVPVHIEQVLDSESQSNGESLFKSEGAFRTSPAGPKAPPLPCSAVLALGKVSVIVQSGVVSTKLERCHLDYREEGLPLDIRTASRRSSFDQSGMRSGAKVQEGSRSASSSQQSSRISSGVGTLDPKSDRTVTLCGVQTASAVYSKGVKQEGKPASVCVAACGVDVAWEADAHLFLHAVGQDVKQVLDRRKEHRKRAKRATGDHGAGLGADAAKANGVEAESNSGGQANGAESGQKESVIDQELESAKGDSKAGMREASPGAASPAAAPLRPLVVSLDLEMLNVGADIGLGWQAFLRAQSVFSEDASIGVLLEGLQAGLNDAVILSSNSLQVSRHPAQPDGEGVGTGTESVQVGTEGVRTEREGVRPEAESVRAAWDVLVQGNGTRLTMPFRMALREAEDAGEDTARALKYILLAMKEGHAWFEKVSSEPKKKKKRKAVGKVTLAMRDFRADIEDEPFQSWLDLHYRMLAKQVREAMVREKLLAEKVGEAAAKELMQEARSFIAVPTQAPAEKGADGPDLLNPALAREAWERVMRQASRAYKEECSWRLQIDGATEKAPGPGGQCTVRVSKERESLIAVSCTSLDVVLTEIANGTEGLTQRVREMDSIRPGRGVPFSRFYGRHTTWEAAGLRLQLRDFSVPLLAAVSGTAEGDMIMAQQATVVPPLVWQELPVGRWQIVRMLRSASGCTPPLKLYTNLSVDLVAAEIGVGTGFEPAYADISYAFTTAIKKAPSPGADVIVASANPTPKTSAAGTPRASQVDTLAPTPVESVRDLAMSSVPFPQQDAAGGLGCIELLTGGSVPIVGLQGTSAIPKERSLPWWDLMRYYVHGHQKVVFHDLELALLATPDPYEEEQMLLLSASTFEVNSYPGAVAVEAEKVSVNLTAGGLDGAGGVMDGSAAAAEADPLAGPMRATQLQSPVYWVDFTLGWDCPSGQPQMHYLHAMPWEGTLRQTLNDPFRSTSLRLGIEMKFREAPTAHVPNPSSPETRPRRNTADVPEGPRNFEATWARVHSNSEGTLPQSRLARSQSVSAQQLTRRRSNASSAASEDFPTVPTIALGAPDFLFVRKWWSLWYYPPMKLRSFARCPRFGVPRGKRSGNLGLDKVLTELMLKIDSTPCCMKHVSIGENDPAEGLTFQMQHLKYDCCWYRAPIDEQTASILGVDYRGSLPRGDLLVVYQAFDARTLRVFLDSESKARESDESQRRFDKLRQLMDLPETYRGEASISEDPGSARSVSYGDDKGFLLSTDCFSLRKQSPKADNRRLATWRIGPRVGMTMFSMSGLSAASDSDYGSGVSGSEEEEGVAVLLADNCLRVSLHGLKLLWTLPNRDAVWSWVHDMARGFSSPKPSPSKQYAQRKKMEEHQRLLRWRQNVLEIPVSPTPAEKVVGGVVGSLAGSAPGAEGWKLNPGDKPMNPELQKEANTTRSAAAGAAQNAPTKAAVRSAVAEEEDGELKFMINVTQPQFNLHSDNASGRFLLAAASGRVLARSFHEAVVIGLEALAGAPEMRGLPSAGGFPIITWRKRELSILLEHVQAHVAPTDVDLNAGIQWLPKVSRDGRAQANARQPGVLLERVFTPCTMVFQYTRHRGGQGDGKGKDARMKPLKHFHFTSPDISASMTSRQFSILMDVITSLLLARLPRARNPPLRWAPSATDDDQEQEEEADEVVPEGIEEVELARSEIEALERECKAMAQDLHRMRLQGTDDGQAAFNGGLKGTIDNDLKLWMVTAARYALIRRLELGLAAKREAKAAARKSLRSILKAAAAKHQQQLKHPSSALRISWIIDKGMWTMLADGEPFAEAEINNMILDLDRDFDDVGFASFMVKHLTIRNCLPHPKCKEILGAWNPPEWSKACILKVEAKQGAPEPNGVVPILHFQVDIHPLRIHLTESLYRMLFEYVFPKDDLHPFRRADYQTAALPPSGSAAASRRGRRNTVEAPNPSLSRQSSGDSLKSPHSPKPGGTGFNASPGGPTAPWAGANPLSSSPVDMDPELMAEVSRVSHTRQASSSGYSSGEPHRGPAHRRTASAIEFGSTDSALLEAVVAQPTSAGRSGSYSGPLAMTAQTAMSLGQVGGLLQVQAAAILAAAGAEGSGSSETPPAGKKRRKQRAKAVRQNEEEVSKSKDLVIHFIKIAQVELVATYEGSPISFSEKRFLMDTFSREHFTGDWRRLFYKVKKHIIWGVLKSVAGVQGKKFRGQSQGGGEIHTESGSESSDQGARPAALLEGSSAPGGERRRFKHSQRSSEGFVSSVKGLFNAQRRKAKAVLRRSQRGSPSSLSTVDDDLPSDGGSDGGSQPSPGLTPGTRSLKSLLRQSSMRRSLGKKTSPLFSNKSKRGSFNEETSPTSRNDGGRSPGVQESSTLDSSPSTSTIGSVRAEER